MRYVSPKTIEQQDMQAIHRIRTRLIAERTCLTNQIRGLLAEYGIVVSQGVSKIRKALPDILEDAENELSHFGRKFFSELHQQIIEIDAKIKDYNKKLEVLFQSNNACQKIAEIEGIGIISATALVSTIGDPGVFKNGRHFSAFLGLVPRQASSGNKERLLGISKRGDKYIRALLIQGAHSVVKCVDSKEDRRSQWIKNLKERIGTNKTAVALANKNARIVWALLAKDKAYKKAV